MSAGVTVRGATELRGTLRHAAADLDELSGTHSRVAALVANYANPPRRTGRLAGSIHGRAEHGRAVIEAGGPSVPYAGVIERQQPYLMSAVIRTESQWLEVYTAGVQTILNRVHGI